MRRRDVGFGHRVNAALIEIEPVRAERCPVCYGSGTLGPRPRIRCHCCAGSGRVQEQFRDYIKRIK
jgi:DnaJ-class molecular chaperone